ncbi:MAG: glycerol-3-phosphate 1-O-acyltransferase PlsY [Chloroflexi bacterium]|nr:glycerol-3-phosphate 1-O-acyltransferase PlsY [Chloroflexota bacterium]OJV91467.1 MAG: acyl-phosphate glycerol 3-phosphate acyltransferase [Chloroflexi bacterium 54-19]
MNWVALVVLIVVAYFISSFPSGVVWGRWIKGIDVRNFGSGKTGATNSLRALGWQISLLVFLTDFSKGAISVGLPILLSGLFFKQGGQDNTPWAVLPCGLASIVGHNHSFFIGFRGGRGVATGIGQVAVVSPVTILMTAILDIPVLAISRYVSLASIVGGILVDVFLFANIWLTNLDPRYLAWGVVMTLYIILSHSDNIDRLLNGTERRLGEKAKPVEPEPALQTDEKLRK